MKGLFVGVCNSQDTVPAKFLWSVLGIRSNVPVYFCKAIQKWGIVRNNQLIKEFLNSKFDVFVKMDVDQEYPPDYFEKMVPLVEKYKVVGPLIFDRWRYNNFAPLVFENIEQNKAYPVDITDKSGVQAFEYFHTNCFYHREALESIEPPWYDIIFKDDRMGIVENGDRYFIQKLINAGYQPHINFDVAVNHLAEISIDRDFYDRWNGN